MHACVLHIRQDESVLRTIWEVHFMVMLSLLMRMPGTGAKQMRNLRNYLIKDKKIRTLFYSRLCFFHFTLIKLLHLYLA